MVWYSHFFQNFQQFIVIHTVKGFGIVNKAEIDVFPELSCFFNDPLDADNLISCSSAFSKTSLNSPITFWQIDGKQWQTLFWGASKSLQMVTAAMKLKDTCFLEE